MLLTKYTFHAMLQNDLPPPTQTASTPRSYSRPFNNFHTPDFCRSATHSIETPCALFQKHRGVYPQKANPKRSPQPREPNHLLHAPATTPQPSSAASPLPSKRLRFTETICPTAHL